MKWLWRKQSTRPSRPPEYMDMEMFFRFFGEAPRIIIVDCTFA